MVKLEQVESQQFNVFHVAQLAPGTFIEELAGLDYVRVPPHSVSEIHRHNRSDNVIFVIRGSAVAVLGGTDHAIRRGMRITIPKAVSHGFRTGEEELEFVSIQIPPILDPKRGIFDREVIG